MSDAAQHDATTPGALVFDLDDTLAPSKSPLDPAMASLLGRLLDVVEVAVISGGQFEQFRKQVITPLTDSGAGGLNRLHLLPACGTQHYEFDGRGGWNRTYLEALTDDEKERTFAALEESARALNLWEDDTWGPILEDRESQVTFSALGQSAPVEQKKSWDPTGDKKRRLREAVDARLPDLEVRAGGSTSIDVTRKGRDKGYGINQLLALTNFTMDDLLFYGDQLEPGGNDYAVKALGVRCIAVTDWHETARHLEKFLAGR
ncbi:HAD-IIB family hydrolase [Spelaeicoccus albus]|uniref:phosphomannomutase n=1 Tax=Spelaeicoccus albus TaxID=1280376 RepID=A0A7Z0A9D1_9MICO|nr:HAD-IIB family hydrolase [Spelaeicoccus albus]NYI66799.1 hypothetical protein [Spelaeicoccus albus]